MKLIFHSMNYSECELTIFLDPLYFCSFESKKTEYSLISYLKILLEVYFQ